MQNKAIFSFKNKSLLLVLLLLPHCGYQVLIQSQLKQDTDISSSSDGNADAIENPKKWDSRLDRIHGDNRDKGFEVWRDKTHRVTIGISFGPKDHDLKETDRDDFHIARSNRASHSDLIGTGTSLDANGQENRFDTGSGNSRAGVSFDFHTLGTISVDAPSADNDVSIPTDPDSPNSGGIRSGSSAKGRVPAVGSTSLKAKAQYGNQQILEKVANEHLNLTRGQGSSFKMTSQSFLKLHRPSLQNEIKRYNQSLKSFGSIVFSNRGYLSNQLAEIQTKNLKSNVSENIRELTYGQNLQKVADARSYRSFAENQLERGDIKGSKQSRQYLQIADRALDVAEEEYSNGNEPEGDTAHAIATTAVDCALGFVPGVGFAKDAYEAFTGENLVTGAKLSRFEMSMAVLGVFSGGILSKVGSLASAVKIAKKVFPKSKDAVKFLKGTKNLKYHGPLNPGHLSDVVIETAKGEKVIVANTFRSSTYVSYKTTKKNTLYRVANFEPDPAYDLGKFWTRSKPRGPRQAQVDLALGPKSTKNGSVYWQKIEIPKGQKLFEGIAGPLEGLPGGGSQIYLKNTPHHKWITDFGEF